MQSLEEEIIKSHLYYSNFLHPYSDSQTWNDNLRNLQSLNKTIPNWTNGHKCMLSGTYP